MTPGSIILSAPEDAVLCDCGEEIREIWSLELPSGISYVVFRSKLLAYASLDATFEPDPKGFGIKVAARPVSIERSFTASAQCPDCPALMTYLVSVDDSSVASIETIPTLKVEVLL